MCSNKISCKQLFPAEITISRERYLGSETRQVIIVTQIVIRSEHLVGDKFPVHDSLEQQVITIGLGELSKLLALYRDLCSQSIDYM